MLENLEKNTDLSYKNLLKLLAEDGFEKKHFALTFINHIENNEDINLIIEHLVDQDTKIRELASFRVSDFISEDNNLIKFLDENPAIIIRTANDVNPQVCRNILKLLKFSTKKDFFAEKFLEEIEACLEETKQIKFRTHKVNKRIFNLYWNLYAIENIIAKEFNNVERLLKIIEKISEYKDYTIRERGAFLTQKLNAHGFMVDNLIEKFKKDENFYIKMVFSEKN